MKHNNFNEKEFEDFLISWLANNFQTGPQALQCLQPALLKRTLFYVIALKAKCCSLLVNYSKYRVFAA